VNGYAIRFLPVDPRDASPALYLSGRTPRFDGDRFDGAARLTSCRYDVDPFPSERRALLEFDVSPSVRDCLRAHPLLRADVVPLAAAIADLANVEERPVAGDRAAPGYRFARRRAHQAAWDACSPKARHAGRRRP